MSFWLTGFFAWSIAITVAALSFLLGWHYAVGFCLIVALTGGVLFGRFFNPANHRSSRRSYHTSQHRYSQTELLQISEWMAQAGHQLEAAANLLDVYIRQQQQNAILLGKLAEVFDAAQIIVQEIRTLIQNQGACRIGIELYYQLERAIEQIEITEALKLQILKQQNKK